MAQAGQATFDARVGVNRDTISGQQRAPSVSVATDVRLSIHDDLSTVERDWRSFEQHADCTAFQTFDWLSTWQRHIGARDGVAPAIVVGRDAAGTMLFLFPLAIEQVGFVRRLTWFGSSLCDYNAPLLAPDFAQRIDDAQFIRLWRDIALRLQSHPDLHYDLVHFEKMPETVGAQRNPFGGLDVVMHPSPAYVTSLTGDWETLYAAKRSSSARRNERKHRKNMAAHGDVRLVSGEDREQVVDTLQTLIEQKSAWFARMGITNLFERPGHRDFFFDLATNAQVRDLVHVSRLAVGPQTAATNLGLRFRDCYYYIIASYAAGELSKFGPGIAHLHELMQHAIGRGFHTFDFSIGEERYKLELCDTELKLYDYLSAATLRGTLAMAPIAAKRRVKHWIKSNPALWQRVRKARSSVASLLQRRGG